MAHPEEFTLKLLQVPVELDRDDVRLALETQEDWAHAEAVVDALGYDLDWKDITQLLERQPNLRQRMADLNRPS
jgi:spore coat polysaccharide biosynthesis protein SpsF (cytidylyltransferase family)